MATIFRGKVVTAVAVLSTTVAVNAQPIQNRLLLESPPREYKEVSQPARPRPLPFVQDVRNWVILQPPPRSNRDWPNPKAPRTEPDSFLFQYIDDQNNPAVRQESSPPTPPLRSLIADAILNNNVSLPFPLGTPFNADDWPRPVVTPGKALGIHNRPQSPPTAPPTVTKFDWPNPAAPGPQKITELLRNGIVLPLPGVAVPFALDEWPNPATPKNKPECFEFYYMQDETRPAFIQYDWPKSPKLPPIPAEQVANRLVLPTVVVVLSPFRQTEWLNASTRQIAKIVDPYNRNVFLPVPQGQPGHQHDWPRPQGARSLQGSHTVDDLGILSQPVARPERRQFDWPLPARPMLLTVIWTHEGTSPLYLPTFTAEWAVNSNQLVGPWAPQPETH